MFNLKGLLCVLFACLIATVGCGGGSFSAGDSEKSDAQMDSDAGHADAKPEASHHDAKPEADVTPSDAPETSSPEAGLDAEEEAEASIPDAPPDAAEEPDVQAADVILDGGISDLCTLHGVPGKLTVVVKVGDPVPSGQVLAIYGRYYYTADAGAATNTVWKFGGAGETLVVATPLNAQTGITLYFGWGFTNTGNMNINGWDQRCTPASCNSKDEAAFCSGTAFIGAFDNSSFVPPAPNQTCEYELSLDPREEIKCKI